MLGVAEGERRSPGDRHHRRGRRGGGEPRQLGGRVPGRAGRDRLGQAEHRVQVDVRRHQLGHGLDRRRGRRPVLGRRHQAQVPRRHGQLRAPWQRAEHRQPDLVARAAQHGLVPVAADPVEHYPDDPDGRVERAEPVQQCRHTARLPAAVDHQYDLRPEQPGHVCRRAVPVGEAPVEEPHHAFDDRHLGPGRAVPEQWRDPVLADQHRVQVPARPPGGQGVVAGVDVVGADLERRHGGTAPAQRGRQPGRDRRLPAPRRRCRDDQRPRRHAHGRLNEPTPTLPATRSSLGSA